MAENKKSFLLYTDVHHTVKKLTDEQAGKLFKHILSYVNDENPELNDFIIEIAFEPIKQSLKRDLIKYEEIIKKRANAGSLGGMKSGIARRSKKEANEANALKRKQTKQKEANEAVSDSVIVNEEKIIIDYNFVVENYHSLCPKMKRVEVLNDLRKGFINARVGEYGMEKVISIIRIAGESNFLNGKNDDAWKADFEWILRPNNFIKIMEGKYENKKMFQPIPEFNIQPTNDIK
jgi:hypothetical protein